MSDPLTRNIHYTTAAVSCQKNRKRLQLSPHRADVSAWRREGRLIALQAIAYVSQLLLQFPFFSQLDLQEFIQGGVDFSAEPD